MEDVFHHEVILRTTPLESSFFGVFDGHRGVLAAQYCQENLSRIVAAQILR